MRIGLLGLVALSVVCKTAVVLVGMYAYVYHNLSAWWLVGSWVAAVFVVPSEFKFGPGRSLED